MKKNFKIIASLSLLAMLMTSCNEVKPSSTVSDNTKAETYTVTWVNYDNSVLEIDENVRKGSMPSYNSQTPYRVDDDRYVYTFVGWSPDLTKVVEDVTYVAKYKESKRTYNLKIYSEDRKKGDATCSGLPYFDETITITAIPQEGYKFNGWYDDNHNLVSVDNPYIFKMPNHDYKLTGYFNIDTSKEDEQKAWDKSHGVVPTIDLDNKTITYGLYPQTRVSDEKLIKSLNEAELTATYYGYYLFNNEYYVKEIAQPRLGDSISSPTFNDGATINDGETYWYKCEPITWNILSVNNDEYTLLSSLLLNVNPFNDSTSSTEIDGETIYANNYEHSKIRFFLNNDFYSSAFALNHDYVHYVNVSNETSTTKSDSNPYVCNNTDDFVYLPSYKDLINKLYGFDSSTGISSLRQAKPTDYAKARGAFSSIDNNFISNGCYWTRSPSSNASSAIELGCGTKNYIVKPTIDLPISKTLTATMAKMHRASQDNYVTDNKNYNKYCSDDRTNIRKLTPNECRKLQGFPSDWKQVVSDCQAYKQFGNAVTVNVSYALANVLFHFIEIAKKDF